VAAYDESLAIIRKPTVSSPAVPAGRPISSAAGTRSTGRWGPCLLREALAIAQTLAGREQLSATRRIGHSFSCQAAAAVPARNKAINYGPHGQADGVDRGDVPKLRMAITLLAWSSADRQSLITVVALVKGGQPARAPPCD
jgi:hypothetical protein